MTKKYKLIAMDIDGTIFDNDHKISHKLRSVIGELTEFGIIPVLVSARPVQSVLLIAADLGAKSHVVGLNGSLVVDNSKIVFSHQFDFKLILPVVKQLAVSDLVVNCYDGFNWYVNKINDRVEDEASHVKIEPQVVDLDTLQRINKVTLTAPRKELEAIKQQLQVIDTINVSFSSHEYLEIQCRNSSKAHGLRELVKSYGVAMDEVIAFGDGENDIPMLRDCGLGVAMGNSLDHIKAEANCVTATNHEDGVALFLIDAQNKGMF